MALPLPRLDDRTFALLVREGQGFIPRRAPGWTDHNAHDPGITLLELFAALVEEDFYRLDRTPPESTRAFLRLVGVEPAAAAAAEVVLELARPLGAGPATVAAALRVTDAAGAIAFETEASVHVPDARLVALATTAGGRWLERGGPGFEPFGPAPAAGDALYLGFDAPLGAGGERISLHAWSGDDAADDETRRRLAAEPGDWRLHYGVRTVWEYPSATGWAALPAACDETRALSLGGSICFDAPPDHAPGGAGPAAWASRWLVRCRVASGRYECRPVLARLGAHAVRARHAARVDGWERLGVSDARAGQTFTTARAPVVAGSVELRLTLDGGELDQPWQSALHADRVGAHDRVAIFEPERGRLRFGDGRVGRVPPAGARIECRYRVGGGAGGNVPAGTLAVAPGAAVSVVQPFAARGGAPAEALADAIGRAIAWLAEPRRAVTLADHEALALAAPGVPIARAWAVGGHHPDLPCVPAAGCVTLVAVPRCPGDRPEASAAFLDAIRCWLAPRLTVTTELHVVGPRYRAVSVRATLSVERGRDPGAIQAAALAALDGFFHPLRGGPDGTGWPAGRAAYRSEVLAVLGAVSGVDWVEGFSMQGEGDAAPTCGNVSMCADQMAAPGEHHIAVATRPTVRSSHDRARRGRREC